MGRGPTGVYIRDTADWFTRSSGMIGAFWQQTTPTADGCFDLFNNSQTGQYLYVYDIQGYNDGEGSFGMEQIFGHGANFLANAVPILIGGPAPPAALYWDNTPFLFSGGTNIAPDPPISLPYVAGDESAGFYSLKAPGPLAIIPSGYSLRYRSLIGTGTDNASVIATFLFTVLSDTGD